MEYLQKQWHWFALFGLMATLLGGALIGVSGPAAAQSGQIEYEFAYELDRTAALASPFREISLYIEVGPAEAIELSDDAGEPVPFEFDEAGERILVTTDATRLVLSFLSPSGDPEIGTFSITPLKFDKGWAWSHSLEGLEDLRPSIELLEDAGVRGTLFLVSNLVGTEENPNDDPAALTLEELSALANDGWSIGNATFNDADCTAIVGSEEENIRQGQLQLVEIFGPIRPDYPITAFASPCSLRAYDLAFGNIQRADETTLLFNESGGLTPLMINPDIQQELVEDGGFAFPLDPTFRQPVGRDLSIDIGEPEAAIDQIDWINERLLPNRHFWYNTASSGDRTPILEQVLTHVEDNYGSRGDESVWIAPSDEIVAYLFLKNQINIRVDSGRVDGTRLSSDDLDELSAISVAEDTPTPVNTPTGTPTNTPTATPTNTPPPTITPSATPTASATPTFTPVPEIESGASPVEMTLLIGIGLLIGGGLATIAILGFVFYLISRNNNSDE